jgi:hypothetical protein
VLASASAWKVSVAEGSAGGAGDVRKLRQAGAEVALLDPGVQLAGVAAARGGDPVSEVSLRV